MKKIFQSFLILFLVLTAQAAFAGSNSVSKGLSSITGDAAEKIEVSPSQIIIYNPSVGTAGGKSYIGTGVIFQNQKPVCGNGICEPGEADACPVCRAEPCPATPCVTGTCPQDCQQAITTDSELKGVVGKSFTAIFTATGGTGGTTQSYTWTVSSGSLPPGLQLVWLSPNQNLNLNSNQAAVIGTPTQAGTYQFTLTATSNGVSRSATFVIFISPASAISDVINVQVHSSFSLSEGQTARTTSTNGNIIDIKLDKIVDNTGSEPTVAITVTIIPACVYSEPACQMDIKPQQFTIKKGETVKFEELELTFNDVYYGKGDKNIKLANFNIDGKTKPSSGSDIKVTIPSSFSLWEGQSAYLTNYQEMRIKLLNIYDSETYVKVHITMPGGCGKNADPRCLGPPAFSMSYDIAEGQTVDVLGLKLTFVDVYYAMGVKHTKLANFYVSTETPVIRPCPENCVCKEGYVACSVTPIEVEVSIGGTITPVTIARSNEGKISITKGGSSAITKSKILVEESQLIMVTSTGNKTIKVMPDTASSVAVNQLQLKNYEIELKDVGKPVYEVQGTKEVKVLGFINAKMRIATQVDAQTGTVIKIEKPWWSFLTR